MEITFTANRGELTGNILNYKSEELFDGKAVTITKTKGRVTGQVWTISHPRVNRGGIISRPTALTLADAKKLAAQLIGQAA